MTEAPRILLVDDDEDDSVLVRDLLSDAFGDAVKLDWVDTFDDGLAAMLSGLHDVHLVDYRLGGRDGLDLVREAVQGGCRPPIIFLTAQDCRQTDMEAMSAGAVDYLVKDEIGASLLERSIRYAIERKRVEQRLEQIGFEDGLTGLWNRSLFDNRLAQAITLAEREERNFAIVTIDLDGFKAINDGHGHAAGDAVLIEVAGRAKSVLRASDTIARIGGDEFAALLPTAATSEEAALVAKRLLDACRAPIVLDHGPVTVGLSVGIAVYPQDGDDSSALLSGADRAMYQAKRDGGGFAIAGASPSAAVAR